MMANQTEKHGNGILCSRSTCLAVEVSAGIDVHVLDTAAGLAF